MGATLYTPDPKAIAVAAGVEVPEDPDQTAGWTDESDELLVQMRIAGTDLVDLLADLEAVVDASRDEPALAAIVSAAEALLVDCIPDAYTLVSSIRERDAGPCPRHHPPAHQSAEDAFRDLLFPRACTCTPLAQNANERREPKETP